MDLGIKPIVDERYPKNRYATHKETPHKKEVFMLFPKEKEYIEKLYQDLRKFSEPSLERIKKHKRCYPNISAEIANYKSNEKTSFGKSGFILYRKAIYHFHVYQFVDNNYSKIEVAGMYDPKQRKGENVLNELLNIIEISTERIPNENCMEHSI